LGGDTAGVDGEKNFSLNREGLFMYGLVVEDVNMNEIHAELAQLNSEVNTLMEEILKAWEELK